MAESNKTPSVPCAALEENLVLHHYGELDGAERAALEAHLQSCAGCAGYLEDLRAWLPLTVETDQPPPLFWADFTRDLRHKLDDAAGKNSWRRTLAAFFQPRLVPVLAGAAAVALALTFTLGKAIWSTSDLAQDDAVMMEVLPVAENLEFFKAMDVLDNLDLLESMGSQGDAA